MWAALRSDLEEFVTTVKEESTTILPTTARANDEEQGDIQGDIQDEDQKQQGVIVSEDGDVMYEDYDRGAVMEEIDRLICEEETFLEPLDPQDEEVTQFLSVFDIESKTDDISKLLEENPETLQVQFESLVPTQISYKEFWERFYFRCDEERIQRQWEHEQEEKRKARAEAIAAGVQGVKNLFGGAVKAVSSSLNKADESVDAVTASPFQSVPPPHGPSVGGIHLFGASGRPPFVMNTAVDEEDDEEEEELGWDDDEEDLEDSEDVEYEEGDSEGVVEFSSGKDEELEKIMQQLTIATEERDQLHYTVEMQAKEIARLQSGDISGGVVATKRHDEKAMEKLKMELFEKHAELAALKASLEDTHEDSQESAAKKDGAKLAALERELEQLRGAAVDKETDIAGLKTEISNLMQELHKAEANADQLRAELELNKKALAIALAEKEGLEEQLRAASESDKAALAASYAEKNELKALVKTLQEKLAVSQSDADSLRQTMESSNSGSAAQDEAAAAKAQAEALTAELEELNRSLHFTTGRADHLEVELQEAKDALKKHQAEFATKLAEEIAKVHMEHEQLSSDTAHSESTGVKVAVPPAAPPTVTRITGTADKNDEEEDWGDDWGDEDD